MEKIDNEIIIASAVLTKLMIEKAKKAFLEDYEKICDKHGMRFDCQGNIVQEKK